MLSRTTLELIKERQVKKGQRFLKGPLPFEWINANIPDPASRLVLVARAFMDMKGESSIALTAQVWAAAAIDNKDGRYRVLRRLRAIKCDYEVITRPGRTTLLRCKTPSGSNVPVSGRARALERAISR